MKNRAKARFKGAMRFIRSHENSLRKDSLAKKLLCKNDKEFWKEIKRTRSKVSLPNVIDGVTGSDSIVNMWRSHYNDLFNCIKKDNNVHDLYNNVCYEPDIEVSHADITSGIEGLANNKSCGLDVVSAEHLKHCCNRILPMLAMCFTGFFIHGMLPLSMISVVLVHIVKDKLASVCSTSNYRPIALASIMSKLLETIILNRISGNLVTNPNQFDFKPKHNTEMCIII